MINWRSAMGGAANLAAGAAALLVQGAITCGWLLISPGSIASAAQPVTQPAVQQPIEVAFSPDGGAEALILKAIGTATQTIRVAAYSYTSAPVTQVLIEAHRRGVEVGVVVDADSNKSESARASRSALNLLVNAGIYVRTVGRYAILHDKFIVVDSLHVQTGSFNYSAAAAKRNSENVVVIWNRPDVASRYLSHWQSRWEQGTPWVSNY